MSFSRWIKKYPPDQRLPLAHSYQATSTASADLIWSKIIDLADVSWHPLIARTHVPCGLVPKPGLIYQAVCRWIPLPMQIFVERVDPHTLLSVRLMVVPGLEERVTYQVESSVCGTRVHCSVSLRGWLAPLVWSIIRKPAARVAFQLAIAAENPWRRLPGKPDKTCFDV